MCPFLILNDYFFALYLFKANNKKTDSHSYGTTSALFEYLGDFHTLNLNIKERAKTSSQV